MRLAIWRKQLNHLIVVGILGSAVLYAQEKATLSVFVYDRDGHAVTGAEVRASSPSSSQTKMTDPKGRARFLGLGAGRYELSVVKRDFDTEIVNNLLLGPASHVDIRVILGRSGEPPSPVRMQTIRELGPEARTVIEDDALFRTPIASVATSCGPPWMAALPATTTRSSAGFKLSIP